MPDAKRNDKRVGKVVFLRPGRVMGFGTKWPCYGVGPILVAWGLIWVARYIPDEPVQEQAQTVVVVVAAFCRIFVAFLEAKVVYKKNRQVLNRATLGALREHALPGASSRRVTQFCIFSQLFKNVVDCRNVWKCYTSP